MMNTPSVQATLDALLENRASSKTLRLAIAVALDTPVGELRELTDILAAKKRYELHLIGPDETIQSLENVATLHQAYLPEDIDNVLGNLLTSGGMDLCLLLPDPRRPEPSAEARLTHASGHSTLTGISLLCPERLGRPLLLADTMINDRPKHDDLESIIKVSQSAALKLGISNPKTALLAAVEVANPGLPVTMLEAEVAAAFANCKTGYVQGPLSMDLAINPSAAKKKKAKGEVPGKADILVAPSLTVARGILHCLTFACEETVVNVLLGGPIPVAVGQRGVSMHETAMAVQFSEIFI
ncbi:MAG TPA: hypothetical protein ENH10_04080 [Bacteroidetes bacterium]|nr:hypothetical protein [Bacteroidota bacterium]HEX04322.1 hypothetical protein [Bacteroidota bacterium]